MFVTETLEVDIDKMLKNKTPIDLFIFCNESKIYPQVQRVFALTLILIEKIKSMTEINDDDKLEFGNIFNRYRYNMDNIIRSFMSDIFQRTYMIEPEIEDYKNELQVLYPNTIFTDMLVRALYLIKNPHIIGNQVVNKC
jgi:hypothetical protein